MDNSTTNYDVIGQVYQLKCLDETISDCYIGSSINLHSRLQKHKHNSTCETSDKHNLRVYQKIREFGGWDNWTCNVLEETKNPTRSELIQLERKHYEQNINNATLNTVYCGRTEKEGRDAWLKLHPNYLKNYKEKHCVEIKQYYKDYYISNKTRIDTYNSEKVTCECGRVVNRNGMARHTRTKKHIKILSGL